ncbi:hypothetical protein EXIGLDRAFT_784804 [Exidia glandulosa HHB12029]|uniref:Uncharacterized protein n=1 Tax=Exidia glandulosa HHB12029 TaxID=1314781 RepID=A0A165YYC7_EXIGL|nr:hypothetical protein EXIGLDRAFT_784804 [Exidia glandulosa HHB12029]
MDRRNGQERHELRGGAPAKDTPTHRTPAAPAAATSSARLMTRKVVASETPGAGSSGNAWNNDPAPKTQGRRAPARIAFPRARNPAVAHTYPGPLEHSQIQPDRISDHGTVNEGVFMPGAGETTARLALNSASTSGVTVTVALVDYESLVTFYEATSNLDGMTGVSHAAVRGRKEIDRVRRVLHDHDEAMRSIGLARKELRCLEDKIAARRREGEDERSERGEKEK